MVDEVISSSPLGKSDHVVLSWKLYIEAGRRSRKDPNDSFSSRLNYNKADYEGMCASLAECDWSSSFEGLEVEDMWKQFKEILHSITHKFAPPSRPRNKSRTSAPW